MTTPSAHDHPDWARTISGTDVKVWSATTAVGVGTVVLGRFLVGNLTHIQLSMSVDVGGARMFALWYDQETGGTTIATDRVDCRAGIPARGALEVLGPWVQLSLVADAAGRNVSLQVWQSLTAGQGASELIPGNMIAVDTAVLGAGATRTDDALVTRWGHGHWFGHMEAATTFFIKLLGVDYQGNTYMWDAVGLGIPMGSRRIVLPRGPMRIVTTNFDAAPHNISLSLNYHVGPY